MIGVASDLLVWGCSGRLRFADPSVKGGRFVVRRRGLLALVLLCSWVLGSCGGGVTGSEVIVSQSRDFSGFDRVAVRDGLRLELRVGSSAGHSVVVRYDDNVLDEVITRIEFETRLVIELADDVSLPGDHDRAVVVEMPRLESLDAAGGARVMMTGLAERYSVRATEGAHIDASDLCVLIVEVAADEGAHIEVCATVSVTGEASQNATVSVIGTPPVLDVKTTSGATVSQ